jgi:hypothetical protein
MQRVILIIGAHDVGCEGIVSDFLARCNVSAPAPHCSTNTEYIVSFNAFGTTRTIQYIVASDDCLKDLPKADRYIVFSNGSLAAYNHVVAMLNSIVSYDSIHNDKILLIDVRTQDETGPKFNIYTLYNCLGPALRVCKQGALGYSYPSISIIDKVKNWYKGPSNRCRTPYVITRCYVRESSSSTNDLITFMNALVLINMPICIKKYNKIVHGDIANHIKDVNLLSAREWPERAVDIKVSNIDLPVRPSAICIIGDQLRIIINCDVVDGTVDAVARGQIKATFPGGSIHFNFD